MNLCVNQVTFHLHHSHSRRRAPPPLAALLLTGRGQVNPRGVADTGETIGHGGAFVLGFFTPSNATPGGQYVGIWYNNIPVQTVVWVANWDAPVIVDERSGNNSSSSTLPPPSLALANDTTTTNIVLSDAAGRVVWTTNVVTAATTTTC